MSCFAPQVSESCPPHDRRFPQSESRGIIGDGHDPDNHTAETIGILGRVAGIR